MSITEAEAKIFQLRSLLADVHTSLIASGWREDQLIVRVKKEAAWSEPGQSAVSRMIERPKVTEET